MTNLAPFIDHTILRPDTVAADIRQLCDEAQQWGFAAVCVPPYYVSHAARFLEESTVRVATVAGFPMGYATTAAKIEEIKRAIDDDADELDVVINLAALKTGDLKYVRDDIDRMTTMVQMKGKVIKVILETGLLTEDEIVSLCQMCWELKVDYVKTSTGFNGGGATLPTIQLMHSLLKGEVKIKASGGIRTREDALRLIAAGADRIGTSSGVLMMREG